MIVEFILPGDVDDPSRPSGGNVYDRRLAAGLAHAGWTVREHPVAGAWPTPSTVDRLALARLLAGLPDGALVLVDGLVASVESLAQHASRLRFVVLLHMPPGDAVLDFATAVITTSHWCAAQVRHPHVRVATPGVDPVPLAPYTSTGARLLCVAAVSHHKGHDLLVPALASLGSPQWRLSCVGTVTRSPDYVARLRRGLWAHGLHDRVAFTGPLHGRQLHAAYAGADLLVLPSRGESYGMVVTEALARGIPVLATEVGGVPEALGHAEAGLLVPPDDPARLAGALQSWLASPALRASLRAGARSRRTTLPSWSRTVEAVAGVLSSTADGDVGPGVVR